MKNKFTFEMCSDLDFEGMVIDISWQGERLATLNQDQGFVEIEVFSPAHKESWKFNLTEFEHALQQAKKLLTEANQ